MAKIRTVRDCDLKADDIIGMLRDENYTLAECMIIGVLIMQRIQYDISTSYCNYIIEEQNARNKS